MVESVSLRFKNASVSRNCLKHYKPGGGGDKQSQICSFSEIFGAFFRDAETTILIKFVFWRGLGRGKIYGKLSQNGVFPGKFHDNIIWKLCEFYCQKFCCHLGGSYFCFRNGQSTVGRPKWTKMDLLRPKWTISVSRMLKSRKRSF